MLTLYKRHLKTCGKANRLEGFTKKDMCRCPIWIEGTHDGRYRRHSLKTNSLAAAQRYLTSLEDGGKPQTQITIEQACAAYIAYRTTKRLNQSTFGKYKRLATRLQDFASLRGLRYISELTFDQAVAFSATWKGSARTVSKTLERARSLGKFGVRSEWFKQNPFEGIDPPEEKVIPRIPFTDEEVQRIIGRAENDRELAFLLTLRHTGLRIGDASLLSTSHFVADRIYLYTTKGGIPVSVAIPPTLCSLLKALTPRGGYLFVRGESTSMHTCADLWRRRFKIICKQAGIMPDHPHRMRHTLAADLLSRGVSVENVAAVLGNSPAIVIKYYSQWIRSRQDALDAAVVSTWSVPSLVRVK